jgi:hypothetical protein
MSRKSFFSIELKHFLKIRMPLFHYGHGHEQSMKLMDKLLRMFRRMVDIQHPSMSPYIKHELWMELCKASMRILFFRIFFIDRRDFRAHKLDPTTGQMVTNPIEWLEMKDNIQIV